MSTYRNIVPEIPLHTAYFVALLMILSIIASGTNTHFVRTRCVQYSKIRFAKVGSETLGCKGETWHSPTVVSTDLGLCPGTAGMPIISGGIVNTKDIHNCTCCLVDYIPKGKELPF